jgi:hypothetical protein
MAMHVQPCKGQHACRFWFPLWMCQCPAWHEAQFADACCWVQASFTNELIPLDVRNRCFPGSQTTDIMKSSAWVDVEPQQLPVLGYLKVQAHLSGVPVSSMNAELADQLAVDLGLPYAQVRRQGGGHVAVLDQALSVWWPAPWWQTCRSCTKYSKSELVARSSPVPYTHSSAREKHLPHLPQGSCLNHHLGD